MVTKRSPDREEDSHESRITALEEHVADLRVRVAEMDKDIKVNTEVTQAVKEDTSEMIGILKGSKTLLYGVKLVAGVVIAIAGAWAAFKGAK